MSYKRRIPKAQKGMQTAQAQNVRPAAIIQKSAVGSPATTTTAVAAAPVATTPAGFVPKLGGTFRPSQGGAHTIMFNDPTSKRSVVRDSKGNYFLTGYDAIDKSSRGVRMKSTPLTAQQAQYFMKNTDKGTRHYSQGAGEHLGQQAKKENEILNRQEGSYHADGTPALTFKRKGGILYRTEEF